MTAPAAPSFPASSLRLLRVAAKHGKVVSCYPLSQRRRFSQTYPQGTFHDYFVVRLPSSSVHPESRPRGPHHKLPRQDSIPHSPSNQNQPERSPTFINHHSRDTTTVRIPLRKAKHHFGASTVRGTRAYNEDKYQAGTLEIPSFAKRAPLSIRGKPKSGPEDGSGQEAAETASGDPQIFYFGVFDGHGGEKCSNFLRDKLHNYIEQSSAKFGLESTLQSREDILRRKAVQEAREEEQASSANEAGADEAGADETEKLKPSQLEQRITRLWRDTVGGYFRRFKPVHFTEEGGGQGKPIVPCIEQNGRLEEPNPSEGDRPDPSIANVLTHCFLTADYNFVTSQVGNSEVLGGPDKSKEQPQTSKVTDSEDASAEASTTGSSVEGEEEEEEPFGRHLHHSAVEGPFIGGSTCSCLLISTPSPTPFWHPSSPFTLVTAHVGDTRILLCSTATGAALALTSTHHPSAPSEAARLRRFAGAFTTDSFGEERVSGLANTRAFGDVRSKRLGVSAEPEIKLLHASPAAFSFAVLVSDGVTLSLSDQEIVDIVKEAKDPEQGARDVVTLATELAAAEKGDADNATAMVVRLGGWERRSEGGGGSIGTREKREWRRSEANDPRRGRT